MIAQTTRMRKIYKKDKIIDLKDLEVGDIIKVQDIDSGEWIKDDNGIDTFIVMSKPYFDDIFGPVFNVTPLPLKKEIK